VPDASPVFVHVVLLAPNVAILTQVDAEEQLPDFRHIPYPVS
jgi:hypothetical protein